MLHKEEWLKDAQALPIGRCNRIYHGAEHRPNLVVWNLEDRWSAYCHACKEGAVVKKDFVKIKRSSEDPVHTFLQELLEISEIIEFRNKENESKLS